jgi:hypothetical protein
VNFIAIPPQIIVAAACNQLVIYLPERQLIALLLILVDDPVHIIDQVTALLPEID